ncbi:hypothetical protein MMC30_002989 [Trapelia coarctata]|nr:hypothetical protein [Trapelia coarctata]
MATNNMHNLTTLIKRLEAATSRLEDIASSAVGPNATTNGVPSVAAVPTSSGTADPSASRAVTPKQLPEALPPAIEGFDALINGEVAAFVNMSEGLGGLIAEQSASVLRAFAAERKFLIITTKAKKPDIQSQIYMEILKELQAMIGAVNDIRVANRGSPIFTHLTTIAEGIAMLGWITTGTDPKPADFVTETLSSAQFYGNRVLKEYKDKDHTHVEWVQGFYRIFKSLIAYIKQHYPSGVTWNNKDGIDPQEALRQVQSGQTSSKAVSTPSASSAPAPPPPPPLPKFDAPPPPPMPTNGTSSTRGGTSDMGAVFDQLSKGEAVTAGLRKVDPSQQTHKNPSLRAGSAVPPARSDSQTSLSSVGKAPGKRPKPESMRTKKPPRKELDGNKWIIENFDSPSEIVEIDAKITHSILISRCTKTTIRVHNKANAISIDSSSQVSLLIDSLVSAVDVIKTPRFELQVFGTLPTIMLDQVDGATLYLGKESLRTEVFTSKCTAVNINVPGKGDEEDYRECPLPEQIKSVVRNGVVISEIVEHAG